MFNASRLFWCYVRGRHWWLGVLSTIAGVLCGCGVFMYQLRTHVADQTLADNAVATTGKIVQKTERTDWLESRSRLVYALRYQYVDSGGIEHQGSADVPESVWKRLAEGDPLPVWYIHTEPAHSWIDNGFRRSLGPIPSAILVCSVLVTLFGLGLMLFSAGRAWQRMRVVTHGITSVARVTEIIPRGAGVRIGYTFVDERGMVRDGQTHTLSTDLAARWQLGDRILVLYHPNDVLRHEADLYGARASEVPQPSGDSHGSS